MPIKQLYLLVLELNSGSPRECSGPLLSRGSSFFSTLSTLVASFSFLLGEWQFSQDYKDASCIPKLVVILPPENSLSLTPLQRGFNTLSRGKQ